MPLTIYLAAASAEYARAELWARVIRGNSDLTLISTWHDDARTWAGKDHLRTRSDQRNRAELCYAQLRRSRAFWLLYPEQPSNSGAIAELGIAIALAKQVVVSGAQAPRNVFTACSVVRTPSDESAYEEICRIACGTTISLTAQVRPSDRPGPL